MDEEPYSLSEFTRARPRAHFRAGYRFWQHERRHHFFLSTLWNTGARIGEGCTLTTESFVTDDPRQFVRFMSEKVRSRRESVSADSGKGDSVAARVRYLLSCRSAKKGEDGGQQTVARMKVGIFSRSTVYHVSII